MHEKRQSSETCSKSVVLNVIKLMLLGIIAMPYMYKLPLLQDAVFLKNDWMLRLYFKIKFLLDVLNKQSVNSD